MLVACGGGGSSSDSSAQQDGVDGTSKSEASTTSSTSLSVSRQAVSTSGTVYRFLVDGVALEAVSGAQGQSDASGRAHAQAASDTVSFTLQCDKSGTAAISISGGTSAERRNGKLDADERYDVVFDQCATQAGALVLTGEVSVDVESVSDTSTSVLIGFTALQGTAALGSTTLDGDAELTVGSATDDSGTRTDSVREITSALTVTTSWNGREATLLISDADILWTATWDANTPTNSTLAGHWTISGTVNKVSLEETVTVDGVLTLSDDGKPSSGSWTSSDSKATVTSSVTASEITVEVDDGNDGDIDHSWTLTLSDWIGTAG